MHKFKKKTVLYGACILAYAGNVVSAEVSRDLKQCLQQEVKTEQCKLLIEKECSADNKKCADVSFDDITVVGTRTEVDISKYPGSATRLTAKDLTTSTSAIESLAQVPGVETGGGHGRNMGQQYTIRGWGYQSEARVIIKLDGVRRSPSLYSNHISTFRADNDLLKSIDVVKGSSSVAHGGGAIGGVIGMNTKDAYDFLDYKDTFGVTVQGRYESNNHKNAYVAVYGTANNDQFDYLLYNKRGHTGDLTLASKSIEGEDGVFDDIVENDEDINNVFVKVGFNPTSNQRIVLSHYSEAEDTEATWQTVYHSKYGDDPVVGELEQNDTVLNYTLDSDSTDLLNLTATVFNSASSYDRHIDFISRGQPTRVDYKNEDERYGINLKNLFSFSTGSVNHRLLVGMDYEKREEDASYVRNGEASDFGSMPNEYNDFGIYFQEEASFLNDTLILYLGGRYDSFKRDVHDGEQKYDNDRFSPRIGVSYEVVKGLNLLANFSEAFRAPTPHETSSEGPLNPHYWYLPNPDVGPETSAEYELGFSYVANSLLSDNDNLWLKAMYFNGKINDLISLKILPDLGVSPDDSPYATYENVDDVKRHGLELQVKYQNGPWDIGLTYETLDQYDTKTKEKEPNAFADKVRLSGAYTFSDYDITVYGDVSHWLAPDQNPETLFWRRTLYTYVDEAYTQANIRARWTPQQTNQSFLDNSFELELGVNNVFDDDYINARNVLTTSRTGKGRNIYLTMLKRF